MGEVAPLLPLRGAGLRAARALRLAAVRRAPRVGTRRAARPAPRHLAHARVVQEWTG